MAWEYFISHASEDKPLIVAPFAHYLQSAGFDVWYDEFSLKVGDSLLQSINGGLSESKFAVVVLSPAFFDKRWPQQELAGLYALESSGKKRILPIWHQVSAAQIAQYSPILADRKAADSRNGLQNVAEQIVAASFPERVDTLPLSSARNTDKSKTKEARKVLRTLLKGKPSTNDVFLYLSGYTVLLESIVGYAPEIIPGFKLPGALRVDFAELIPHGVSGPMEVLFIVLGPVEYDHKEVVHIVNKLTQALGIRQSLSIRPANEDYLGSPYFGEFPSLAGMATAIRTHVSSGNVHWEKPDTWSFKFMLVTGRRDRTPRKERDQLANDSQLRLDIASYDRLLDDRDSLYR
uniref:TIR domain-containing protein n=1 Tax=Candidatus Kentrum sp. TC TaxID=2126339 RepID=A0A450ZS03_9GAMM|nr:MAG: TIR domain-containing protein [Candidatus Kentron sp. TC]